ncbi:MAG: hypothetical protein H0U55_13595 [Rubrobacteraceae bacterium]|nr:hypothetical protein [Rubrobacteraceae bacterium]
MADDPCPDGTDAISPTTAGQESGHRAHYLWLGSTRYTASAGTGFVRDKEDVEGDEAGDLLDLEEVACR